MADTDEPTRADGVVERCDVQKAAPNAAFRAHEVAKKQFQVERFNHAIAVSNWVSETNPIVKHTKERLNLAQARHA